MKLLLVTYSLQQIQKLTARYEIDWQPSELPYVRKAKVLHHEVDLLITGAGIFQTSYKVTKALISQKYHLALKVSIGAAYKPELEVGTIVNIVNDKPGDFGTTVGGEWKDLFDLGLIKREDAPQVRSGFVNLTNAYMNVFLPYKKAVGLTVNQFASAQNFVSKVEHYRPDCETTDGLGFTYPCLFEKQLFYHLCAINHNLATGQVNDIIATENLNTALIDIIQKL